MIIVVNDANILIDLVKLQLVEPFFRIPWEFHSTSLILENENYKMLISKKDKMLKQKELENQKLKEHIANQQKAIVQKEISHMEDLNAAKRIQSMMFKNTEKISNYFTESFFIQQKKI
jgi:hypothetical protein